MRVLLVGGGNMGMALLSGWRQKQMDVTIVEPFPGDALKATEQVLFATLQDAPKENYDVVVLAVKPQLFPEILPDTKKYISSKVILSIAAGKTIANMTAILGEGTPIIRTMPNTPALIGQGISVCVASPAVSAAQKAQADELLGAVGDVLWIEDENLMHGVTALSGSGPAYVFALIEAMQKAGEACGLSPELALTLSRRTVQGAGALALSSGTPPTELRRNVTSPNGTTEAALRVLLGEDGLDALMAKAIRAADSRSRELSS